MFSYAVRQVLLARKNSTVGITSLIFFVAFSFSKTKRKSTIHSWVDLYGFQISSRSLKSQKLTRWIAYLASKNESNKILSSAHISDILRCCSNTILVLDTSTFLSGLSWSHLAAKQACRALNRGLSITVSLNSGLRPLDGRSNWPLNAVEVWSLFGVKMAHLPCMRVHWLPVYL